jgi:murein DD-endopeptidase MepM/ murein hydrolase activator NlpD
MKFAVRTTAGGAQTLGRSLILSAKLILPLAILAIAGANYSYAQTMYKYRGENGEWTYTDRKPAEQQTVEVRVLETTFIDPEFSITHEVLGRTIEFVAHNEFYAPIEVRLKFIEITGVEYPHPDQILRWVIDPRSDQLLLNLEVLEEVDAPFVEYQFEYMPGDPTAQHPAGAVYQAPFSAGRDFPITQAYPDAITHQTLDSVYAVDISMSVGTDILAARDGVVFDVAAHNYRGGLDLSRDGQAANIIRILHDDGTFSLYAHLNWNSIRVKPGDRVRAGQYIADSGNTGFTSGPHLHFAVQRNSGLTIQSLPVVFKGASSNTVVPATGDVLTAYQ